MFVNIRLLPALCTVISWILCVSWNVQAENEERVLKASYAEALEIVADENQNGQRVLNIQGFGKSFELQLEENNDLTKALYKLDINKNYKIYKGKLNGIENSWVRISEKPSGLTGAFFDGQEVYLIDHTNDTNSNLLSSHPLNLKAHSGSNIIVRESDLLTQGFCAANHGYESRLLSAKASIQNSDNGTASNSLLSAPIALEANATEAINIIVVADTEYSARVGGIANVETEVVSLMNVVDGIFSSQVGVTLVIQEIQALTDNQNLTSNGASALLDALKDYVDVNIGNNPGLVHLFTGKNLVSDTVGIAVLQGICAGRNGVGLSQSFNFFSSLVIAHEFGHNFGAPHDAEPGSACVGAPSTFLMNPSINGSDQFSDCSLTQIQNTINSRGGCLVPAGPTPEPTPPVFVNINGEPSEVVSYGGAQDVEGEVVASDAGNTISLRGNNWKAAAFDYTITPNTILEFDFVSDTQGEIHAIGFDTDLQASTEFGFKLYGTQNENTNTIQNFNNYADVAPDTRHYVIPVGEFFTGPQNFIFFENDDDALASAHSQYSNIIVYEDDSSEPTPIPATPVPIPATPIPNPITPAPIPVTPVPGPTVVSTPSGNNNDGDGLVPGADSGGGGALDLRYVLFFMIVLMASIRRRSRHTL